MHLDSIDVVGAGPAGLYAAILLRAAMPDAQIRVHEQNPRDATFGFGVVFSDQALGFLAADDPETHDLITPHMEHWRNMTLMHRNEKVTIDGIGFSAIGRLHLIQLLQARAAQADIEIKFNETVTAPEDLDADLIIGADGFNSRVRNVDPEVFETTIDYFSNQFAWFGVDRPFDDLNQTFVQTDKGALNAHHYRYTPNMSTFIVECDASTFAQYGFADMDEDQSAEVCETIFVHRLGGRKLKKNKSIWRRFPKLWCNKWVSGNRVLIGDAAHTAHFSIGSGTRLAMEDAIALVKALEHAETLEVGLQDFEASRIPIAKKIVDAANSSALWYDEFAAKMALTPMEFAFNYMTRSGRIDLPRLRSLAPQFMDQYEAYKLRTAS